MGQPARIADFQLIGQRTVPEWPWLGRVRGILWNTYTYGALKRLSPTTAQNWSEQ